MIIFELIILTGLCQKVSRNIKYMFSIYIWEESVNLYNDVHTLCIYKLSQSFHIHKNHRKLIFVDYTSEHIINQMSTKTLHITQQSRNFTDVRHLSITTTCVLSKKKNIIILKTFMREYKSSYLSTLPLRTSLSLIRLNFPRNDTLPLKTT